MAFQTLSLAQLERSISYAISDGAEMIYFHHGVQQFMYFIGSDKNKYQEEMSNLKANIREGCISVISAGEPINISGTDLFPIDFTFDNQPCFAYMLLRRRGRMEDADNTPYFFKSEKKRDQVMEYLSRSMP